MAAPAQASHGSRGPLYAAIRAYMLAGGAVCAVLASADWVAGFGVEDAGRMLPTTVGLGMLAGMLAGLLIGLATGLSCALPARLRLAVASLSALAWTYYQTTDLGALSRLSGSHSSVPVTPLAGLAALALAGATAFVLARPTRTSDPTRYSTRLAELAPRARTAFAVACALVFFAAVVVDRTFFLAEYPLLRDIVQRSALLAATLGFGAPLLARWHATRASSAAAFLVAGACALYPLARLDTFDVSALNAMLARPFTAVAVNDARFFGDFDGDGFSRWLGGGDCEPLNPAVNPGRRERRDNGIDDNCRLGDNADAAPGPSVLSAPSHAPPASIVLITVNALRADHVGVYGYRRRTTPNIDEWFRDAARFDDAYAPGAHSTISLPALMYGVHARRLQYGVMFQTPTRLVHAGQSSSVTRRNERVIATHWLAENGPHPTLAALLREHGMQTAAVIDDGMSGVLAASLIGSGFDSFVSAATSLREPQGDPIAVKKALQWLERRARDRKFFLWLHLHGQQSAAKHDSAKWFGSSAIDRYDHEINYIDEQLAPLFATLERVQSEEPLITVLTANHGEGFLLSGRAHGARLSEDELRVPLLVRGVAELRGNYAHPVSSIDLTRTLLAISGARIPSRLDGHSLLSPADPKRVLLADSWSYTSRGDRKTDRVAALSATRRFVFDPTTNAQQLFAREDPVHPLRLPDARLERAVFEYLEEASPSPRLLLLPLYRSASRFVDDPP